jgi:hypothetical protein
MIDDNIYSVDMDTNCKGAIHERINRLLLIITMIGFIIALIGIVPAIFGYIRIFVAGIIILYVSLGCLIVGTIFYIVYLVYDLVVGEVKCYFNMKNKRNKEV